MVETKTPDLFVWAIVNTETGEVDVTTVQPFDDELYKPSPPYEWRRFRLVPEDTVIDKTCTLGDETCESCQ